MENFFRYSFNIEKIVLACYVPKGGGEAVHMNRGSHGLALHISGDKKYTFDGEKVLYTGNNDVIFMPEHSNYVVEAETPGDCYAINFKIADNVSFEPFVLNMGNLVTDKFKSAEKAFRLKMFEYEMQCKADLYSIICSMFKEHEKRYVPKTTEKIIDPAIDYSSAGQSTE